jgi:hypothetical protein
VRCRFPTLNYLPDSTTITSQPSKSLPQSWIGKACASLSPIHSDILESNHLLRVTSFSHTANIHISVAHVYDTLLVRRLSVSLLQPRNGFLALRTHCPLSIFSFQSSTPGATFKFSLLCSLLDPCFRSKISILLFHFRHSPVCILSSHEFSSHRLLCLLLQISIFCITSDILITPTRFSSIAPRFSL